MGALGFALTGCLFAHENDDVERRPETAIGSGARIQYPGQPSAVLQPSGSAPSAQGGQTGSSGQGTGSDSGPALTVLGGSSSEVSGSSRVRKVPLIGPLTALFGYPFWVFGKSLGEKAEAADQERDDEGSSASGSAPAAKLGPDEMERRRLARENDRLRQELAQGARPAQSVGTVAAAPPSSIGDELAALERSLATAREAAPAATPTPAPVPPPEVHGAESPAPRAGRLQHAVDRDADGRPDLWVYGEGGVRLREESDENRDGRPDRIRTFDREGKLVRLEEDVTGDGTLDTVTVFESELPIRKRADTDGDGETDAWSFYRDGNLVRHEVDRDGDGFRDLVLLYQAGELSREEEDRDGDGRPDVVTRYEAGQIVQKDEDLDFDGTPDVRSFFRDGKLLRREIDAAERAPEPTS